MDIFPLKLFLYIQKNITLTVNKINKIHYLKDSNLYNFK